MVKGKGVGGNHVRETAMTSQGRTKTERRTTQASLGCANCIHAERKALRRGQPCCALRQEYKLRKDGRCQSKRLRFPKRGK